MIGGKRAKAAVIGSAVLGTLVLLAATGVSNFGGATDGQVFIAFAINLVFALGVQTFMGSSGIVSFGHMAFAAIGAFAAGLLTTPVGIKLSSIPEAPTFLIDASLGFVPATLVAMVIAGLVAVVVGIPLMRLHGTEAGIATFALLVIVQVVLLNVDTVTRGAQTFYGLPKETGIWAAAIFAVVALFASRLVRESDPGLSVRSTQGSALAAESSGVRTTRSRMVVWVASAMVMALGGSLYAHFVTAFSPNNFNLTLTFTVLTMIVLGGQSIFGAFVGATLVTALTEFLRRSVTTLSVGAVSIEGALLTPILLGLITIVILMLRPQGLADRTEPEQLPAAVRRSRLLSRLRLRSQ